MDSNKSHEFTKRRLVIDNILPENFVMEENKKAVTHRLSIVTTVKDKDEDEGGIYYQEHEQDIRDKTNDIYKSEAISKERVTTRASTRPNPS